MLFNSFEFLWFLPLLFLLYWGIALWKGWKDKVFKCGRWSNSFLLLVSYLLYAKWNPVLTLVLLEVTMVTYFFAIKLEDKKSIATIRNRKLIIWLGLLLSTSPLLLFKYYNFFNDSVNDILLPLGFQIGLPGLNWAIPIGISFYSFMAIGYLVDVYYERIKAERNLWDYMLFISFFPQITSGPISKASSLLPQIKSERTFDYNQAVSGCRYILWGMFLKVVLADRLGIHVDTVYASYEVQSGTSLFLASIFYTLQIYGDFAGYSYMAVGVGKLMGFNLINNFEQPYFSSSITEFWHRWHISLSIWLKDYVYIPLGGSKCSKVRNYFNIMVTFLISGIWHGANWTFIIWGALHGLYQVIEKMLGIQKASDKTYVKLPRILITFLLVNLAWIFFRMPSLETSINVFEHILTNRGGQFLRPVMFPVTMSVGTLFIYEVLTEFFPTISSYLRSKLVIRWIVYVMLTAMIVSYGVLDAGQFIYVSF